ncbi:5870_t:CDS:1 [Ambispora gerdemannii]|uniref:5870_t:CDS:1 n=1 Tax=Ambispora gerdemannii TaxID=144530 RepID=A0A9N8W2E2_9GLOM|nr:5870_t:CDS:1 [Ambispora gerdemannii]
MSHLQLIENNARNSSKSTVKSSCLDIVIKVPFPPKITAQELAQKKIGKKSKNLNAFIIYRRQYLEQMHRLGFKPNMTLLSKKAGSAWEKEPQKVKKWYSVLAEEVVEILTENQIRSPEFIVKDWNIYKAKPEVQKTSNRSIATKTKPEKKETETNEFAQPQITIHEPEFIFDSLLDDSILSNTLEDIQNASLTFPNMLSPTDQTTYEEFLFPINPLTHNITTTTPQQYIESNLNDSTSDLLDPLYRYMDMPINDLVTLAFFEPVNDDTCTENFMFI